MGEAQRPERPEVGEVVLRVKEEVIQHGGLGASHEVAFAQRDQNLQHIAPEDHDSLLAIYKAHAGTGHIQLARLPASSSATLFSTTMSSSPP